MALIEELRTIAEYVCWDKFEDRFTSDPKKHPAWRAADALEAKDRELAEALADPSVVHRNMLRGTIAKPSMNNIAHLYPEVQQMKEALLSTLKHFRWPTSSERETRDKVLAALAHFDEPPSSVLSSVQPVSGSREQRGNEEG